MNEQVTVERVRAELAHLGESYRPATGWEDRVIARVRRARRRRQLVIAVSIAAAAAVVFGVFAPRNRPGTELQLALEVERGRDVLMGPATPNLAHVGDTLRAEARGAAQLRVYLDGTRLLATCPGDAGCRDEQGVTTLSLPLRLRGTYDILVIGASAVGPQAPTGNKDRDLAAEIEAGAAHREHTLHVE